MRVDCTRLSTSAVVEQLEIQSTPSSPDCFNSTPAHVRISSSVSYDGHSPQTSVSMLLSNIEQTLLDLHLSDAAFDFYEALEHFQYNDDSEFTEHTPNCKFCSAAPVGFVRHSLEGFEAYVLDFHDPTMFPVLHRTDPGWSMPGLPRDCPLDEAYALFSDRKELNASAMLPFLHTKALLWKTTILASQIDDIAPSQWSRDHFGYLVFFYLINVGHDIKFSDRDGNLRTYVLTSSCFSGGRITLTLKEKPGDRWSQVTLQDEDMFGDFGDYNHPRFTCTYKFDCGGCVAFARRQDPGRRGDFTSRLIVF